MDSDERNLSQILQIIQTKAFLARSSIERGTLLLAVGRSNTAEAAEILKNLVRKKRLFGGERLQETRLLAVAG
ncbi:MAG: hypothetical protein M0C28_08040 [Candidatus Moduliflexus flocculans]|nr:hypothetical protein [Candidatus Moduliflexus flocculans]